MCPTEIDGSQLAEGSVGVDNVDISGDLSSTGEVSISIQGTASGTEPEVYIEIVNSTTIDLLISGAFLAVDSSIPITITLPQANRIAKGLRYTVKDSTGHAELHNITILADGTDKIDGQSSYIMINNYQSRTFVSNNVDKWFIV